MLILKNYWWQISLVILLFGATFTVLGVYETHSMPFFKSFVFWTTTMLVGVISSVLITPYVVNTAFKDKHPFFHIVYASLICSVPVTFVLTIFNPTFSVKSPLYVWGIQYLYVLVVSLVVGSILYPLLHMMGAIGAKSVNEGLDNGPSTFLKRLPLKYHEADLYAVSSEDHYLRVYTNIGEELILMRLADALKELSETKGLQVHRSWWVHEASVLGYRTEGGRRFLTLKQDLKVPVSRSYIKQVQQTLKLG